MLDKEEHYKYKAFISYSHKDEKFGAWLHKSLEKYKIPNDLRKIYSNLPKKIYPIFRDREELSASSDLPRKILEGLHDSEYLIVICSVNSAKSKWVNQEIIDFKKKHGEDKVLAVILDGEPNANSSDKFDDDLECFPEALKFKIIDAVLNKEKTEPLAPDFREGKDEKELGKLKLIAGVLKVNFDDLWEREKKERFKQRSIKGIFLLLFVVLIGFGYFKYKENNDLKKYGFDYISTVKIIPIYTTPKEKNIV